ncbi:ISC system 2Fe-2S type ferredoxin [Achromobacter sp. RTa]|uniref:ISC system 2Fe-2S type ferredoxin n=1 Tax=Achromobacter sp. RTa TaxID=1532557 RepID=UPI00069077B8|nr:ISC system 2Fe-2S type ferredoxin [Achromobacter sp. RTa]
MPIITVLPHADLAPEGAVLEASSGTSISEALLANGIEIEHACDMSCACTTCHCIVRRGFDSLNEVEDCEDDLLDRAWGLEAQSRLSCQAIVGVEDLTVEIPKYTVNHAKESRQGATSRRPAFDTIA